MIPGGLEPPTSVLQTYAIPAATASKCISLVDEMLSYRLLFENFGSFIACDKYFLLQKKQRLVLPLVLKFALLFNSFYFHSLVTHEKYCLYKPYHFLPDTT